MQMAAAGERAQRAGVGGEASCFWLTPAGGMSMHRPYSCTLIGASPWSQRAIHRPPIPTALLSHHHPAVWTHGPTVWGSHAISA